MSGACAGTRWTMSLIRNTKDERLWVAGPLNSPGFPGLLLQAVQCARAGGTFLRRRSVAPVVVLVLVLFFVLMSRVQHAGLRHGGVVVVSGARARLSRRKAVDAFTVLAEIVG